MHTLVVVLQVIANIILVLALISIIVGVVWTISPLKDKMYMGSLYVYKYYTPLGGRGTGLSILGIGLAGLVAGFLLDEWHSKLRKKFGGRT